jgi:signal peptide peptidase SppA
MHKYYRALNHYTGMPWAITKSKLLEIQGFIIRKAASMNLPEPKAFDQEDEEAQRYEAKARPRASVTGDVAVINAFGVIAKRMDMFMEMSGGSSIERMTRDFRDSVNNASVKAIVLNIDSPGGSVFGVQELADEIYAARDKKHIVGLANDMACSAAYWLMAACDEAVCTPSGVVGSIGVYTMHEDWSRAFEMEGINPTFVQAGKYKTEGNFYEPLSDEAKAEMQKHVDFYYNSFIRGVALGRGVSVAQVKSDFGQGRVFNSSDAKAAGLIDRVDTLDGVLEKLGAGAGNKQPIRSASAEAIDRELQLAEK